jgi:hypothetical protein
MSAELTHPKSKSHHLIKCLFEVPDFPDKLLYSDMADMPTMYKSHNKRQLITCIIFVPQEHTVLLVHGTGTKTSQKNLQCNKNNLPFKTGFPTIPLLMLQKSSSRSETAK